MSPITALAQDRQQHMRRAQELEDANAKLQRELAEEKQKVQLLIIAASTLDGALYPMLLVAKKNPAGHLLRINVAKSLHKYRQATLLIGQALGASFEELHEGRECP